MWCRTRSLIITPPPPGGGGLENWRRPFPFRALRHKLTETGQDQTLYKPRICPDLRLYCDTTSNQRSRRTIDLMIFTSTYEATVWVMSYLPVFAS